MYFRNINRGALSGNTALSQIQLNPDIRPKCWPKPKPKSGTALICIQYLINLATTAYSVRTISERIKCIRCTLLRPIFVMTEWCIRQSVCHSAKTAARIEVLSGVDTPGCTRGIILDGGSDIFFLRGGGEWGNVAFTYCNVRF